MKTKWDEQKPLLEDVREVLSEAVESYFEAGEEAFRRKIPWKELHHFRLASKRFRYTLELFREFYGRTLDAHLKELKKIQTYLGDINDLIATRALLKGHAEFKKELRREAREQMKHLRKHWKDDFSAEGRKEAWLATIAGPKLSSGRRTR